MDLLRRWFEELGFLDRRKAHRQPLPGLVAYYWNRAAPNAPKGRDIRDISLFGLYLFTEEQWYPGTVIRMTLQRTDRLEGDSDRSIIVPAMVVRADKEGIGFAFNLPQVLERPERRQMGILTNKQVLHRFLDRLTDTGGRIEK